MLHRLLVAPFVLASMLALGGCIVRSAPVTYTPAYYGYSSYAAPSTVYYNGGYHNRVYYPAGYYARHAPFVVAQPSTVVVQQQPQTVYVQQPVAQPVAQPTGVGVGVGVGAVGVGVSGGVRVY